MATQIDYFTDTVTLTLTTKQYKHMMSMIKLAKEVLVKKRARYSSQILAPVVTDDPLLSGDFWAEDHTPTTSMSTLVQDPGDHNEGSPSVEGSPLRNTLMEHLRSFGPSGRDGSDQLLLAPAKELPAETSTSVDPTISITQPKPQPNPKVIPDFVSNITDFAIPQPQSKVSNIPDFAIPQPKVIPQSESDPQAVIPFEAYTHLKRFAEKLGGVLPDAVRVPQKGYALAPILDGSPLRNTFGPSVDERIREVAKYLAGVSKEIKPDYYRYFCTQLVNDWYHEPTNISELHYYYRVVRYSDPLIGGIYSPRNSATISTLKALCKAQNIPVQGKKSLKATWEDAVREYYHSLKRINLYQVYTRPFV